MSKKEKKLMMTLKIKSLKLKEDGQIPLSLYQAILRLNYESRKDEVVYLMDLSERYMRVKGFYLRFPDYAKPCDDELKLYYHM